MPRIPSLHSITRATTTLITFVALLTLPNLAPAQCTYTWPANPFAGGCDGTINAVVTTDDGSLFVGGAFTFAGGIATNGIARWDGSAWSALGTGMNGTVRALALLPNGDLIAGGDFTTSGGVTTNCIARWDGTNWNALGAGIVAPALGRSVQAVGVYPSSGDVYAGGAFAVAGTVVANNLARWDGTAWHAVDGGTNGPVRALVVDGYVFVTGDFTVAGTVAANGLARWTPFGIWTSLPGLGPALGGTCLTNGPGGNPLYVGGTFQTLGGVTVNRVARASSAPSFGLANGVDGPVASLLLLPTYDLLAGGSFAQASGVIVNGIARWDGTAWSGFGAGVNGSVNGIALEFGGDVILVGDFTTTPQGPAGRIARIRSSCVTRVTSIGNGCIGSGGLNTLVATRVPAFLGPFEWTGSGLAPNALVLAVFGTQPFGPLTVNIFGPGFPGCTIDVNLEISQLLLPSSGSATTMLTVGGYFPALIGLTFDHQYWSLEVDPLLNITGISTTNALRMTFGTF